MTPDRERCITCSDEAVTGVVVRIDGATLRTEVLRYSQAKSQVSSDRQFVFDEPTRHVEGDGFTADPDFKVVTALHPRGGVGKFTLPNQ